MGRKKIYTEKEQTVTGQVQLYRLSKLARKDYTLFRDICDQLPFYITINKQKSLDSTFVSKELERLMGMYKNEILHGGFNLIQSISHRPTLEYAIDKIRQFDKNEDMNAVCNYFQFIKFQNKWEWIVSQKTFLSKGLYLNSGILLSELGPITKLTKHILDDTMINGAGWKKFQSLTKREKQLLKLIAQGKTNNQIAEELFISNNTVRTHRNVIMKKIDAHSLYDIIKFSQAFELTDQL